MRDPNRIDKVLKQVSRAWHCYPDLRFGQFLQNTLADISNKNSIRDIFFPEDDKWEAWFKEYADAITNHKQ